MALLIGCDDEMGTVGVLNVFVELFSLRCCLLSGVCGNSECEVLTPEVLIPSGKLFLLFLLLFSILSAADELFFLLNKLLPMFIKLFVILFLLNSRFPITLSLFALVGELASSMLSSESTWLML